MSALRKLITIMVFTAVLFVAAFGTSFFAMRAAFADGGAAEHGPKPPEDQFYDNTKHFNWLGSPAEHHGKDVTGGTFGDGVMKNADGKILYNRHPDDKGIYHPAEEEMSAPFIFMILNFVLLLVLLSWKAKPAIEKLAADRHDQIKTALDEAAKLRKQASDRLEEYQSKLAKADAEIKAMVEGIRADAEADKKRILEAADRQAAQMKKDADARIAAEIELARTSLTREVTYAATSAAEKLLREKMTPSDQQQVINTFITGVQAAAQKEVR
jgi:F-type H+-transporting ATPase subunit b